MRLRSWNAYESELTSGIDGSTGTISVTSAAGLTAPVVLVIDPEDQALREYVMATSVAASTLTADRGLAGSAAGGQPHIAGAKIRAVPVHQWLDEIFDDIDAIASDLADHEGAADPHSQYMLKSGSTMTGALVLSGDPVVALNPATKQYTDIIAADLAAHEATSDAHHARYTDGEAVIAMGAEGDANSLNHVRYTDVEAVAALVANGPILKQVVKWRSSMTLTGQGDNNQVVYDLSSFGFTDRDNLVVSLKWGAANQQSRESIVTIEDLSATQLTVNAYGVGSFPPGGVFFTVQIEEYDRLVIVTTPPTIP